MRVGTLAFGMNYEHLLNTACSTFLLCLLLMFQGRTPMHAVCENENSEVLNLLLAAKCVNQDMLKMKAEDVSVHETCYIICELEHWRFEWIMSIMKYNMFHVPIASVGDDSGTDTDSEGLYE